MEPKREMKTQKQKNVNHVQSLRNTEATYGQGRTTKEVR